MKKATLLSVLIILLAACAPTPKPTGTPSAPEWINVTYQVSSTAKSASLTYETPTGREQHTVQLPWYKAYKFRRGDFVYISAQNQGETGTVRVEIKVGGKVWKHAESSGPYVIASADGLLY